MSSQQEKLVPNFALTKFNENEAEFNSNFFNSNDHYCQSTKSNTNDNQSRSLFFFSFFVENLENVLICVLKNKLLMFKN